MEAIIEHLKSIGVQDWGADIFWAVIIVLVTAGVAHAATKALRALLDHDRNPLPSSSIIVNIVRAVIWAIGGSIVLDSCFGINPNALVTALGVGGIAISLGFQDTLSNLIGGIQVTFMGIVKPGDNIEVGSETGIVQDVSWRHTTITNARGETVIIPNSIISKTALVQLPPTNKVAVPFAVVNDSHPMNEVADALAKSAKEAAGAVSPVTKDPAVFFTEVTEYGFRGTIIVYIEDGAKAIAATDAIVRAIAHETR